MDLYLVLFAAIRSGFEVGHGCAGYYFGENGEQSWYDISRRIASNLVELGRSSHAESSSFGPEEISRYLGQVGHRRLAYLILSLHLASPTMVGMHVAVPNTQGPSDGDLPCPPGIC